MASFYAELQLEGNSYRVVHCVYTCRQATDTRGRAQAKVRHAPLELVLDVPLNDVLLSWANTPHKPLAGEVIFYDTAQQAAHETIAFAAGECVQYAEQFASSATGDGAYVCQLTITAPSFELRAGGPATVMRESNHTLPALKAIANLAVGGGEGLANAADAAAAAATTLTPRAIAQAVNPLKGLTNCSQIAEAVIARLHGTDPQAVAPDAGTRTLREIEELYGTTFEPIADFHAAFTTVNDAPAGAVALLVMGPREVTETSMGHIVTMVNHQGQATIIEAQHWDGYNPVEAITSPTRAIRRYGDAEETELGFTFIPSPALPPT